MKIIVATNNQKKVEEISESFAKDRFPVDFISLNDLNIPSCLEPHHTFIENAIAKAKYACLHSGLPAIADDSGLCISAFSGSPGVCSAHWAEDNNFAADISNKDVRNNAYLCHKLQQLPADLQNYVKADYHCALVFVTHPNDYAPIVVSESWQGIVRDFPVGKNGFGYDAHFYIPYLNKTAAQLTIRQKNTISHRGLALKKLKKILIQQYLDI